MSGIHLPDKRTGNEGSDLHGFFLVLRGPMTLMERSSSTYRKLQTAYLTAEMWGIGVIEKLSLFAVHAC